MSKSADDRPPVATGRLGLGVAHLPPGGSVIQQGEAHRDGELRCLSVVAWSKSPTAPRWSSVADTLQPGPLAPADVTIVAVTVGGLPIEFESTRVGETRTLMLPLCARVRPRQVVAVHLRNETSIPAGVALVFDVLEWPVQGDGT